MYCFVWQFDVGPDHREEFRALGQRHAQECLASEPGTLHFYFFQDEANPDRFYAFEAYADQAALDAHRTGPVVARNGPLAVPMLAGSATLLGRGSTLDTPTTT